MSNLILFPSPFSAEFDRLINQANKFIESAKSAATVRAYKSDWADFVQWTEAHQFPSLPASPETVALYIADRASTLAAATICRRLTSISRAHQAAGFSNSPASTHHFVVRQMMHGIRRVIGTAQHGKDPLLSADIRKLVASCADNLSGRRDRALILVGFTAASRRSEIAFALVEDLTFCADGVVFNLRKSKTDQEAKGRKIGIPFGNAEATCPVGALRAWLSAAEITSGPVFRAIDRYGHVSPHPLHRDSVGYIIKRAAARAGLDIGPIAGHSLRSGFVTQSAMNKVPEYLIRRQTGQTSATLQRYIRLGELFINNPVSGLGI